jgi:heme-degrading monooxygenase HmoA
LGFERWCAGCSGVLGVGVHAVRKTCISTKRLYGSGKERRLEEANSVIARVWHGFAPTSNASKHVAYLQEKLLPTYVALPGNRGALLLARSQMGCAEFLVVSMWESVASLEALIGGPEFEEVIEQLETHPDLLSPTPMVKHYEVIAFTLEPDDQNR